MVAGYCWSWITEGKNNTNIHDIEIGDFGMSWNLDSSKTWAIDPESVMKLDVFIHARVWNLIMSESLLEKTCDMMMGSLQTLQNELEPINLSKA